MAGGGHRVLSCRILEQQRLIVKQVLDYDKQKPRTFGAGLAVFLLCLFACICLQRRQPAYILSSLRQTVKKNFT